MTDKPFSSTILNAIFENFWLKLIALVFALGFYALIHSEQDAQRTIAVKLVVEKPPADVPRRLMTPIPPSVDVTIVGPFQQLEGLRPERLSIALNLQAAQSIDHLKLLPDMVSDLPPRVRVDRIMPNHLQIQFEDIITRDVEVQVARTGEPAAGMEVVGKTTVEPIKVVATGIESAITVIQYARTEAFDVSGLSEGQHQRRLRLDDPPENVSWSEASVQATMEIARKLAQREFVGLPVAVVGVVNARLRPATVTVKVEGLPDRVEALNEDAVVPRIDLKAAGADTSQPGSANLEVIVDIPDVALTITPAEVFVSW